LVGDQTYWLGQSGSNTYAMQSNASELLKNHTMWF